VERKHRGAFDVSRALSSFGGLHRTRVAIGSGPRPGTRADRVGDVPLYWRDEGGELKGCTGNYLSRCRGVVLYLLKKFEGRKRR
jgi:hypothetical protein